MKVAVIGAGWAGLAASVALREADAKVTVFEAGRTPGGRARRVVHDALLMRRPLRLASLDGGFRLSAPPLPAPLH
ncbi:FAD-dependent oxidoreductase, partial [Bordetella pertussis]|uniref:FAD-dependent oxidoreductase n=1 Tax=Bordetella pertussis TaxID=520 RepID=UPI000A4C7D16